MSQDVLSPTSLKDTITAFVAGIAKRVPPGALETAAAEMQKLAATGIADRAPQVGSKAPDFSLPDAHGKAFSLTEALARGPVVVAFYRGGWCPFCDLQLRAYQGVLSQVRELGAELVAISPQTPDYTLSDAEKKALTFPVLSDVGNHVARSFGLVFKVSEPMKKVHEGFGSILPKFNGDDSWELPVPGTFVLDRGGVVRLSYVEADYTTRLEPSAILDALRAARG
jgi:peroxiredoxin